MGAEANAGLGLASVGADTVEEAHNCANCGAVLTGPFCQACGQRAHVHRSLLHLGEEFLHGILHFDAKAWRTMPLLMFKPGELTRRYLDGQRTRFVSPLALFLFMMFFMFFVASYTSGPDSKTPRQILQTQAELGKKVELSRSELARQEAQLAAARAKGGDTVQAIEAVARARTALAQNEQGLAIFNKINDDLMAAQTSTDGPPAHGETTGIKTGVESVDWSINKAMQDKKYVGYKLKTTAAKFTFLLVPMSLPFLWLVFCRRRDVGMYDHAVFTLYSLSFMALVVSVLFLLRFGELDTIALLTFVLVPPLHLFVQLRGTYTLSAGSALWRTAFLLLVAGVVAFAYLALVFYLAVH
jgi:hypothetical protein